jgi:hypothetical protein
MSHLSAKFLSSFLDKITLPLIFSCAFAFVVHFSNKISPPFLLQFISLGCYENIATFHFCFLAILPQFAHTGCNEIVTTFMIEKPTSQGMARPCFGKLGVIKLTANRRQFSPISLKRGRKQAKLPDPLWDEGHYRIGFCRPSQDINNSENQALSSCLKKTNSTAELKRKPDKTKKYTR